MEWLVDDRLNCIFRHYSGRPYAEWRSALVRSVTEPIVDGLVFPTFPDPELQRVVQGHPNEIAIRGALHFREHCMAVAKRLGKDPKSGDILIDFGAGWGRTARAFMYDFPASSIFGVEPFDFILEARRHNPYISFVKSDPTPPLPFRDAFASQLVSWSIFSHLNEHQLRAWMGEFERILRPGGLASISVLGPHFVRYLADAASKRQLGEPIDFWPSLILDRLNVQDLPQITAQLDAGGFFFLPDGGSRSDFADSFVGRRWFENNAPQFEIVDYAAEGQLAQDVITLRRR